MKRWMLCAGVTALVSASAAGQAAIVIDGDFSDWAGVAASATSIDNGITGSPDFATLQITDDPSFVYFFYTLHREANPQAGSGVYLAIDSDNNSSTGFDVFGLGLVGSEASWQNDFPFEQAAGVFNTGAGLSNATLSAAPYNSLTLGVEIAIPRAALRNSGGDVFPAAGGTIGVLFYTDAGASTDYIGGDYTMVPEPASLAFIVAGLAALARRR